MNFDLQTRKSKLGCILIPCTFISNSSNITKVIEQKPDLLRMDGTVTITPSDFVGGGIQSDAIKGKCNENVMKQLKLCAIVVLWVSVQFRLPKYQPKEGVKKKKISDRPTHVLAPKGQYNIFFLKA